MATLAIGDIHGNRAGLDDLLGQLRPEVGPDDVVVFLDDYIDRGSDSRGCIDSLLRFRADVPADVVFLRGNHEEWFVRAMHDDTHHSWLLGMDAWPTIESYSPAAAEDLRAQAREARGRLYEVGCHFPYERFFATMPTEHVAFFEGLRSCHRTADCLCVHAGINPAVATLDDQSERTLVWGWDDGGFPGSYEGTETIVYGHRNNPEVDATGWPHPRIIGQTIGLDTSHHGVVTAVRLPDRRVFQSGRH